MLKIFGFLAAAVAAFFVFGALVGKPKNMDEEREECGRAVMSDLGTRSKSYVDKQAYDAHVADKCRNFQINGRPVGR